MAWRGPEAPARPSPRAKRDAACYHLPKIIPPLQREQVLLLRTISFGAFYFAIFYQIKVVARLALRDDFAAGGELDALESVGDSLQST